MIDFNSSKEQEEVDIKYYLSDEEYYYPHRTITVNGEEETVELPRPISKIDFERLEILPEYDKYLKELHQSTYNVNQEIVSLEGLSDTVEYIKRLISKIVDYISRQVIKFINFIKSLFYNMNKEIDKLIISIRKSLPGLNITQKYMKPEVIASKCPMLLSLNNDIIKASKFVLTSYKNHSKDVLSKCSDLTSDVEVSTINYNSNNILYVNKVESYINKDNIILDMESQSKDDIILVLNNLKDYNNEIKQLEDTVYNIKTKCKDLLYQINTGKITNLDVNEVKLKGLVIPGNILESYTMLSKEILFLFKYAISTSPKTKLELMKNIPMVSSFGWGL